MPVDLLMSGVRLAEKAEGKSLYPDKFFRPDPFTSDVLEALVEKYGTVRGFCDLHGFPRVQFLRCLTPQGADSMPDFMADAVCGALNLKRDLFVNRIYEPVDMSFFQVTPE